jgi:hypothetical protein
MGQKGEEDWFVIDNHVQGVSSSFPDSLAFKLTAPFSTDLQKVRAIYSWITQNIKYTSGLYSISGKRKEVKSIPDPTDTMSVWKSGDEMTAIKVMHRKMTVCEGYSKLFKVLCDYAGLQSKVIFGYARTNMGSSRFRSNHAWNAVLIDSTWKLLDITWASGYFDYRNEYVQQRNDYYFLTPPEDFIKDHYPENMRWALLPQLPVYRELNHAPFYYRAFDKYALRHNELRTGVIEKSVGDTITLILTTKDAAKDGRVSPDISFDSSILQTNASAYLAPATEGNSVVYRYIISSEDIGWLHLFYNNDLILRYRLKIRPKEDVAVNATETNR